MMKLRNSLSWSAMAASLVFAVALGLVLTSCAGQSESPVAPSARLSGAQAIVVPTPTPTPTPTPSPGNCSPGFYKTHALDNPGNQENVWYGIGFGFCDGFLQPTCAGLLADLNAGGQTSQAAAAYLNSVTGLTCDDD